MDIKKAVDSIVKKTTDDLVNGKYKLVSIGEHTSVLEHGKSSIQIWSGSGMSCCSVYNAPKGLKFPDFDEPTKRIVYELATTPTEYMIKRGLKVARIAHKKSSAIHKANIEKIKSLRLELQLFKEQ